MKRPVTERAPRRPVVPRRTGTRPAATDGSGLPHADLVTGALSEVLQYVARPVSNTLADLHVYGGRPLAALFPAPRQVPQMTVRRRWRLPGLISEDLVFRSLHVPLEPKFRRRYLEQYRGDAPRVCAAYPPGGNRAAAPRPLPARLPAARDLHRGDSRCWRAWRCSSTRRSIQIQFPYHGRRTPRGSRFSGEFYWTADLVRSFEALRQSVLDARTLLSCPAGGGCPPRRRRGTRAWEAR